MLGLVPISDWPTYFSGPDPEEDSTPISKQDWKLHLKNLERLYARNSAKDDDGGGGGDDDPRVGGEKFGLTSDQLCRLIKAIVADADRKFRLVPLQDIEVVIVVYNCRHYLGGIRQQVWARYLLGDKVPTKIGSGRVGIGSRWLSPDLLESRDGSG